MTTPRRCFQFSLRTLLVAVTVAAALMALLAISPRPLLSVEACLVFAAGLLCSLRLFRCGPGKPIALRVVRSILAIIGLLFALCLSFLLLVCGLGGDIVP